MKRRRAALAGVFAVGAHLLALLALGWPTPRFEPREALDAQPTIELSLVRIRPASAPAKRGSQSERPPPPISAAAPRVLTAPSAEAPALVPPAPNSPPSSEASLGDPRLSGALRGLLGCTGHSGSSLSDKERETCDRRLATAKPATVGRRFSAEELHAFNADKQESIFTRKPHNECLPHIGDTSTPGGSSAASTTFGIACAWSFW